MNVVHISPWYFDDASVVGGGERYAQELARTMANLVPTRFISFGPLRERFKIDNLQVDVFPSHPLPWRPGIPFSPAFLPALAQADIVHCHQLGTPANVLALLVARLLRKPRFVTPLGLAPSRTEHRLTRIAGLSGLPCISEYSAKHVWYRAPRTVIYAGVDTQRFVPGSGPRERKVMCVARLMPHKGINYLIEAIDPDLRLELYGKPYHERYFRDLQVLAAGKDVHFFTGASDEDIAHAYATALVSVLPSVHVDMYGTRVAEPELLGLVLLEAMACGTAVIGTSVTSIPELIHDGLNGYLVPPNDTRALRTAIRRLCDDPPLAARLGQNGRDVVRRQFTWEATADRCLKAYGVVP